MVRDTRRIIMNAVLRLAQKDPDKIHFTLTEIATEARISRQAIYQKHYQNVDDIIQDIHIQIATEARKKLIQYGPSCGKSPFHIIADEMLPVLYEHREWLRVIYTTSLYPGWLKYLEKSYRPWLTPFLIDKCSEADLEIVTEILIGYVLNMFIVWLKQPVPIPPDAFREQFFNLIKMAPYDYINKKYKL